MSSSWTAWMTFSSEAAGSAPGWENTRMPSRKAISVGIERIPAAPDRPGWSSVSTLPNVMSGCCPLAAWNTGANIRHGPHQDAHQSISVIPGLVTVSSNVSSVSATVLIFAPSASCCLIYPYGYTAVRWGAFPARGRSGLRGTYDLRPGDPRGGAAPPASAGEAARGVTGPPVYRVRRGLRELAAAGMVAGEPAGSANAWRRQE